MTPRLSKSFILAKTHLSASVGLSAFFVNLCLCI